MGVDSLGAIEVRNRLQEALPNLDLPVAGCQLIATKSKVLLGALLLEHDTVSKLVTFLVQQDGKSSSSNMVTTLHAPQTSTGPNCWFIHGIDGDVSTLSVLAKALPYSCYGIRLTAQVTLRNDHWSRHYLGNETMRKCARFSENLS